MEECVTSYIHSDGIIKVLVQASSMTAYVNQVQGNSLGTTPSHAVPAHPASQAQTPC